MDKRLEAGWFQRIAWSVLAWASLGLLVWVPFLYVAIRRGRGSDWGAFASFALFDGVMVTWIAVMPDEGPDDAILGLVFITVMLAAALMLLFAMFDRRTPPVAPAPYGAAPQGPYGYPYGR
ncbi:hypothetical protein [Streptomyces sp. NPDC018610]|jgi:apolipoprotein N-acyltransferase|uniref:hypothetical protein n=1 Tax=Streptomyces sp. NPDC018610 TaxID=3365049 RepID=UPI00378CC1F9